MLIISDHQYLPSRPVLPQVELFMPSEEVLSEGEHVNELLICVEGAVQLDTGRLSLTGDQG